MGKIAIEVAGLVVLVLSPNPAAAEASAKRGTCTYSYQVCMERRQLDRDIVRYSTQPHCDERLKHCLQTGNWWHGDSQRWQNRKKQ